jgi:hypothetical protein
MINYHVNQENYSICPPPRVVGFVSTTDCRCTVPATVALGCYNPPPLKKYRPEIMKEERSPENEERSLNHFFDLNGMKVGVITYLTLGSGTCLLSGENL